MIPEKKEEEETVKKLFALLLALMTVLSMAGCTQEDAELLGEVLQEYEQILQEMETAPEDGAYGEDWTYEDWGYEDTWQDWEETEPGLTEEGYPDYSYTEQVTEPTESATEAPTQAAAIDEEGWYYSAEEVALYLVTYGCLPENFITKDEARDLGWTGGSVEYYAPGCAIGGDRFYNYDGMLPGGSGTYYYECDIDTDGYKSRGAKRLVFTYEGDIYYTDDHYETFICLYGGDQP